MMEINIKEKWLTVRKKGSEYTRQRNKFTKGNGARIRDMAVVLFL